MAADSGGVRFENLQNSSVTATHIVGGNMTVTHRAPALRACPTPPPAPEKFGGRADEVDALITTLSGVKAGTVTTLYGIEGIGKTTLAQQVAHTLYARGEVRAVLWVAVNEKPDALALLAEWATLADGQFESKNRTLSALTQVVRDLLTTLIADTCAPCEGNRVLVVLDNVWQDGRDVVKQLRAAAPANSLFLVTTRSEQVAIALNSSTRRAVGYLEGAAAVDFLAQYLPDPPPTDATALATLLGGYPLALELAATRVQLLAGDAGMDVPRALARLVTTYAAGIPADRSFAKLHLDVGDTAADSLTLSFAYSYQDLAPADQQRFRWLGVLPLEAELDVMLLSNLWDAADPDEVEEQCRTLRLAALLTPTTQAGWYRQHRLLRAYARELLRQTGELEAAMQRALPALIHVGLILNGWGLRSKARRYFEGAHLLAQTLRDDAATATALHNIGSVWSGMGEAHKALGFFEQALALRQAAGNHAGTGMILNNMGLAWSDLGEKHKALDYYEQALALLEAAGDRGDTATTLNNLGLVWFELGELHKALSYYERALPLRRQAHDKSGEAITLSNMGSVWDNLDDSAKALHTYQQALALMETIGDKSGQATTLNNMGKVWAVLGESVTALTLYEQVLELTKETDDLRLRAIALNNMGAVWDERGEKQTALDYYAQALTLRRHLGDKGGEATTLTNMGKVWDDLGEQAQALAHYDAALPLNRYVGDKDGEATTLNNMGFIAAGQGDSAKALELYAQALALRRALQDRRGTTLTLNNIGIVWAVSTAPRTALPYYAEAFTLRQQGGDLRGAGQTLSNIAAIYSGLDEKEKALDFYGQALPLLQQGGDLTNAAVVCFNIGMIYSELDDLLSAIDYLERCVALDEQIDHPDTESDRAMLDTLRHRHADSLNN